MHRRYLIDHEYLYDEASGFASTGHLLAFNPGPREAHLQVTIFFEDAEPKGFEWSVLAHRCRETNYSTWPVAPNSRFALEVVSDEPVFCQSTIGWTNSLNDWARDAKTLAPEGLRECAASYTALDRLSQEWFIVDGVVIDSPRLYIRESEWALLLNPGDEPAQVTLALHVDDVLHHRVEVPPRRLVRVYMDDIVPRNKHYGVRFESDRPIAAQWRREVRRYDRPDRMTFWSEPCIPAQ